MSSNECELDFTRMRAVREGMLEFEFRPIYKALVALVNRDVNDDEPVRQLLSAVIKTARSPGLKALASKEPDWERPRAACRRMFRAIRYFIDEPVERYWMIEALLGAYELGINVMTVHTASHRIDEAERRKKRADNAIASTEKRKKSKPKLTQNEARLYYKKMIRSGKGKDAAAEETALFFRVEKRTVQRWRQEWKRLDATIR